MIKDNLITHDNKIKMMINITNIINKYNHLKEELVIILNHIGCMYKRIE